MLFKKMKKLLRLASINEARDKFEDSKFGDDKGNLYSVADAYKVGKSKPEYFNSELPIDKLLPDLEWWDNDPNQNETHMKTVDTSFPLLVVKENDGSLSVADGLNRLKKMHSIEGKKHVSAYVVPKSHLKLYNKK